MRPLSISDAGTEQDGSCVFIAKGGGLEAPLKIKLYELNISSSEARDRAWDIARGHIKALKRSGFIYST